MSIDGLKVLESKIDQIMAQHASVCEERDRLAKEVEQAQDRLTAMAAKVRECEEERADIKARVERILGRLEGIDLG